MIVFPNAKINLGLNVVEKRADGFHNIETLFYPIPLEDALEFIPNEEKCNRFNSSGISIPSDGKNNLVERAHLLLQQDFSIPFVDIHLHKNIPIGAGLGGGSADAAFALKGLNQLFELGLSEQKLENYAAQLGSDCPFFIKNKAVFATGKGHDFTPVEFSLKGKYLALIYPNVHVSTAIAYSLVKAKHPDLSILEVIKLPLNQWKNNLLNDFELSVFNQFPAIEGIKNGLYQQGAIYACMSGSGSSVFGLFEAKPELNFATDLKCWIFQL